MEYEYDFGSTTHLKIKVVDERTGQVTGNGIQLMARNNPPEIPCDVCGKPAVELCVMCLYEGEGALCKAHSENHKCDDDYFLPVVNSPRVGVCGYTGDAY